MWGRLGAEGWFGGGWGVASVELRLCEAAQRGHAPRGMARGVGPAGRGRLALGGGGMRRVASVGLRLCELAQRGHAPRGWRAVWGWLGAEGWLGGAMMRRVASVELMDRDGGWGSPARRGREEAGVWTVDEFSPWTVRTAGWRHPNHVPAPAKGGAASRIAPGTPPPFQREWESCFPDRRPRVRCRAWPSPSSLAPRPLPRRAGEVKKGGAQRRVRCRAWPHPRRFAPRPLPRRAGEVKKGGAQRRVRCRAVPSPSSLRASTSPAKGGRGEKGGAQRRVRCRAWPSPSSLRAWTSPAKGGRGEGGGAAAGAVSGLALTLVALRLDLSREGRAR